MERLINIVNEIVSDIKKCINEFDELAFPRGLTCMYCKKDLTREALYSLCPECIKEIAFVSESEFEHCRICGKSLGNYYGLDLCVNCNSTRQYFDRGLIITSYNDCSRKLIFDLKYEGKTFISYHFGEMIYDRLVYEHMLNQFDYIVPVPIHKKRLQERGFNQTELIGDFLSKFTKKTVWNVLVRTENTMSQNKIGREHRKENVENVFQINKELQSAVKGKNILLLDDIYTTGATVNECSRVLKLYGAKQVFIVAVSAGEN